MEDRYEIRGKIGQGGLGAVYRGYDTRMKREVAIKRISVNNEDPELQAESTRQLIKEAGALASLQHPHIVTVYDVGTDEDGPYVVMELIAGKTLDELIERAPLTWNDFRELALQTQEALIAAQELDLIHSDIKPSNLMLTWLPSGKFQMKIVDFGLATLTQSQSLEELEEMEAVFGSIFFMAPEQFERVPIDARTDMYAMGCVYYQALSGSYPFKGETGNEVMVSHLHHKVIPLQEIRADIPMWACDWIMWHINRQAADRPESARQALQVFLQNDKNPNPTMSLGKAATAKVAGPRPRLIIPGASPHGPGRQIPRNAPTAKVHPSVAAAAAAQAAAAAAENEREAIPEPPPTTATAPQPLLPPEGFKPSVHEVVAAPDAMASNVGSGSSTNPVATPAVTRNLPQRPPKKRMSGTMIMVLVLMVIALAVAGYFLKKRIEASRASTKYDDMIELAVKPGTTEISMTAADLAHFLSAAGDPKNNAKRAGIFKTLELAKPTDDSDFDATISTHALTSSDLLPEDREAMIREVLAKRVNSAMATALIGFARKTGDTYSGVAALEAAGAAATDSDFEDLLSLIQFTKNDDLRKAAEEAAASIIKRSGNRSGLVGQVTKALSGPNDAAGKAALERLKR